MSEPSIHEPFQFAEHAAQTLINAFGPELSVAVVLGSGWAAAADALGSVQGEMALGDLPGVAAPTVVGHLGVIRSIEISGRSVLVFGGRSHLYEGYSAPSVVHSVRSAIAAGCKTIILTNAAGSINPDFQVGQPVLLSDQLNLTGATPMIGADPPAPYPGRFCDVTEIYSQRLRDIARTIDPALHEGVYAGLLGGAFETPAEIRMLRGFGADLVGMSTVLEAIAAKHLDAEVAGISLVTNLAAGLGPELSHLDVLEVARNSTDRIVGLIGGMISGL